MAHAMKRLGVYLGLVEDDPEYAQVGAAPRTTPTSHRSTPSAQVVGERPPSSVSTISRPAGQSESPVRSDPSFVSQQLEDRNSIHTIQPRSYNDARRIGEEYRAGAPVIMNLTEMGDAEAKRIVDFAAGLVFAMHGTIEKVTQKVFLLSPANVDVRDNPAVQRARDGFFNQS
jgi:cell division inhibitor SepF